MAQGIIITGTDTDIGKTWVTAGLLHAFNQQRYTTAVMKPISCGCKKTDEGLRNDDAVLLMEHASESAAYELVNQYAFKQPIAPHLAAHHTGQSINITSIKNSAEQLANKADILLAEGVGGLMVPINNIQTTVDLFHTLDLPLILVVGIRLGCLNHALLTHSVIKHYELDLAGWVANIIDLRCLNTEENIKTLQKKIEAPLLGVIPYLERFDIQIIAQCLDISLLAKSD